MLLRLVLLINFVWFSFMERCTISVLMLMQYDSVEDVQGLKLQGILSKLKKRGTTVKAKLSLLNWHIQNLKTRSISLNHWTSRLLNSTEIFKKKILKNPHSATNSIIKNTKFCFKAQRCVFVMEAKDWGGLWVFGRLVVALGALSDQERPF